MNTLSLRIVLKEKEPWADILVAQLSELNFDAFEEFEGGIIAYGEEDKINREEVLTQTILADGEFVYELEFDSIPQQNWNAQWEADFHPVFVEEKLSILAPFHSKELAKKINIEILPKMSFGTGHHQTTWLMSKAMLEMPRPFPKDVLDMGTGTGVLAILAEKLGSTNILAIDIEPWSAENTIENAERNDCKYITTYCGDVDLLKNQKFDLILANINKNVLKAHISSYLSALNFGGTLMLSGFFDSDSAEMIEVAENLGLKFASKQVKETWCQLTLTR